MTWAVGVLSSRPEDVDDELHGDVEDDGVDFELPLSPVSTQLVDVSAAAGATHIQIIVKLKPFSSTQTHNNLKLNKQHNLSPAAVCFCLLGVIMFIICNCVSETELLWV